MFELFHERDLADGGAGSSFFAIQVDLFQSNELASLAVTSFEDLTIKVSEVVQQQIDSLTVAYVPSPSYGTRQRVAISNQAYNGIPFPAAERSWGVSCPYLDSWLDV